MTDQVSARYKEALRLGHLAVAKGRPKEAIGHYEEAGRLVEARPLPFLSMGSLYLQMRQPREALRAYDEALRRSPYDVAAMRGRAAALDADGRGEEAAAMSQAAIQVEAGQRPGLGGGGVDQRSIGLEARVSEAIRARQAGDRDAAVGAYLAAAYGYDQQNRFDAALDACFRALEARPGAIDVHLAMAGMYLRRGWRMHGVQRVLLLERRLRIDEDERRHAALTALARDHRALDPELERIAATA